MNKLKKDLIGLTALLVLAFSGLAIAVAFDKGKEVKNELQPSKKLASIIVIDHGHTGKKNERFIYDFKKLNGTWVDVWHGEDGGAKCLFMKIDDETTGGPLDCWADGWRNQVMVDCRINDSEHPLVYFIGGRDHKNQNFKIWCM